MHCAISHHLHTNAQPDSKQQFPAPVNSPSMMSYGMEYPFGQFGSAVLAVLPSSFSCISSVNRVWKRKNSWQYKHYV